MLLIICGLLLQANLGELTTQRSQSSGTQRKPLLRGRGSAGREQRRLIPKEEKLPTKHSLIGADRGWTGGIVKQKLRHGKQIKPSQPTLRMLEKKPAQTFEFPPVGTLNRSVALGAISRGLSLLNATQLA